jgi:hypothetical protein
LNNKETARTTNLQAIKQPDPGGGLAGAITADGDEMSREVTP